MHDASPDRLAVLGRWVAKLKLRTHTAETLMYVRIAALIGLIAIGIARKL